MPTTTHCDYLQAFDVPLSYLPRFDEEIDPYLPPDPFYQLFYVSLRDAGASVAEALLTTLVERRDDLAKAIARYEAKHCIAP